MIGGGAQKITVEIGGQIAASLGKSLRAAQTQVSSFGRNVNRTMNDAATAGKKGFKNIFSNDLWQGAAAGAAAIGVGMMASVRVAATFEGVLTDIGKTANASQGELKALSGEILKLSGRNITNLGPEKIAQGIQDLVAQGLELKDATASIETLGKVATATGSDLLDVTKTGFQLQNALKIRPTELKATFDALAFAGKQGAFELRDMAQFMPTIAAAAGSLGIQGREGAVSLAAMMQMVRKDAPDAGQAATRLTDAMLKMTAPDAVKRFAKFGVNIEQVLNDAKAKGVNPMEAALSELQRVTGGDVFKLSQIFGDKEAKLALMSLMKYRKEYEKLKADAGGSAAAGTVDADYQRSIKTFSGTLASFQNSTQRLGIVVGQALLPPLTRLAEKITPVVEGIGNWATANPGLAKSIVLITGAIAGLTLALPVIAGVVSAIGVIGGPVTLAILGISAAIALMIANWGKVKAVFGAVVSYLDGAWKVFSGVFTGDIKRIGEGFNQVLGVIRAWGPKVLSILAPIPSMIIGLFTSSEIGQKIITSIIDGLKSKVGELFGWIRGTWSQITGFFGGEGEQPPGTPPARTPSGSPRAGTTGIYGTAPGRAMGGPVRAGFPYIVGERRRELFVPGMDGAIIPRVARPVTGGGGVTIHAPVTINGAGGDAMEIRRQVELAFVDIQRQIESSHRVLLND